MYRKFELWLLEGRGGRKLRDTTVKPVLATVAKSLDAIRAQADVAINDVDTFIKKVSSPLSFLKLFSQEKLSFWLQLLSVDTTIVSGGMRDRLVNPDESPIGSLRRYIIVNETGMYVEYMASLVAPGTTAYIVTHIAGHLNYIEKEWLNERLNDSWTATGIQHAAMLLSVAPADVPRTNNISEGFAGLLKNYGLASILRSVLRRITVLVADISVASRPVWQRKK